MSWRASSTSRAMREYTLPTELCDGAAEPARCSADQVAEPGTHPAALGSELPLLSFEADDSSVRVCHSVPVVSL